MMLLSLDNLCERYGILPSQALQHGSTFDLMVLNYSAKYQAYKQEDEEFKKYGVKKPPPRPKLTEEQLRAMMQRAKERKL